MEKVYIYNTDTHTLHIEGFCRYAPKGIKYSDNYKRFNDEDEVLAFDGRTVSICKICMHKRDKIIKLMK